MLNVLKCFLLIGAVVMPAMLHAAGFFLPRCTVSSTPLNFGIYWGTSTLISTASITVACSTPATTQVQMDSGLNSINFITRKMAANQNKLSYNIYTNASRSKVWGDGTAGTFTLTGNRLTVYASIPAGQVIAPGTYNDTVVVTIVW